MRTAQVRKTKIEDASGIAFVHVRSWQVAYRGQMPDEFLASLDVEKRANMWRELIQNPGTRKERAQLPVNVTRHGVRHGVRRDICYSCVCVIEPAPWHDARAWSIRELCITSLPEAINANGYFAMIGTGKSI